MKILYDNLDFSFQMNNISFSALNLSHEQFLAVVPKHSHGNLCYELHYVSNGYGIVKINNTAYKLEPNTLYITGPHVEHEQIPFPSNPLIEYSVFFIVKPFAEKESNFLPGTSVTEKFFYTKDADSKLGTIFEQIFSELKQKNIEYHLLVTSLLQQLTVVAIRALMKEKQLPPKNLQSANLSERRTFIIDKAFLYQYGTLSLTKLASDLGLSARQTERFLQKYYKKSFSKKLLESRMSAAAVLLNRPSLSIVEISEKLGYSSIEYFVDVFRKYYHVSPNRYRQNLLKQKKIEF